VPSIPVGQGSRAFRALGYYGQPGSHQDPYSTRR
jgi:hypothetical protein